VGLVAVALAPRAVIFLVGRGALLTGLRFVVFFETRGFLDFWGI
jgi:hypothetical protein